MKRVGKREFTLHTSKYLKQVEETGEDLTITHQDRPTLRLTPIKPKTIHDLRGTITHANSVGDINEPVLPDLKQWSS
jgi:antitoxin (DNA-binding transcriptional repressor) of toxin-antitoxin stability system